MTSAELNGTTVTIAAVLAGRSFAVERSIAAWDALFERVDALGASHAHAGERGDLLPHGLLRPGHRAGCMRLYTSSYNWCMAASAVLTLRLDRATTQRLARLARSMARTRSRLAAEAIEKYLDDNAWQVEAIEEGVRAADAGEVVSHADVVKWAKSWGKPRELKRPR